MAEQIDQSVHFITQQNQPLIGIILGEKGYVNYQKRRGVLRNSIEFLIAILGDQIE